ncbi:hypothetical protein Tco_1127912 [Tanacetum coccineum]
MHANKSFNRNPANHRLYRALMKALIEDENEMDKGVAKIVKNHKRKHNDDEDDDDEDPPARLNQGKKTKRRRTKESESSKKPSTTKETPKGKALTKGSKTGKSASANEPVQEPIAEVVMDGDGDDQPPRPLTPDPEWNKRQVVLDQPTQPWFNQMVSASKDPLTFNDLMTTPIDFHKRKHDDDKDDDDEDPTARPNQGSKTSKSALAKELVEEPIVEVIIDDAGDDVVCNDDQPQDTLEPKTRKTLNLDWFKQPPRPPTPDPEWNKHQLDWNNPERDRYPFDLSKPLPLQGPSGHRTVAADYFFNNDLEYLKTSDPEVTYTTSITKTKAARYEIKGIKDMVLTLWSTIKHAYDKDVEKGIKHWGERHKLWYRSQVSKFSKQNVYSTKAILGVKSVSVKKLHEYGHLEEIGVKRSDQQIYKFKEGDFVDLHLNDIEDMLLLAIQHKLFHLDGNVIVDFIVALNMFTRSLILKRRVGDLELGVESY